MTQPDDPLSRLPKRKAPVSPSDRMRTILSAGKEADEDSSSQPVTQTEPQSALPEKRASIRKPRFADPQAENSNDDRSSGFGLRRERILPAFWTVASVVSLMVNAILLAVIVALLGQISTLQGTAVKTGGGLLGGLYHNFELMDRAHIRTTIPVDAQVPVNFNLQIDTKTEVVLSQDVLIDGANVKIESSLININAPATVTLPAGSRLPVNLNMTVPVSTFIPIHLEVPVDIALSQTDLHEPFVGLKDIVQPFYCMVEPNALSADNLPVCK